MLWVGLAATAVLLLPGALLASTSAASWPPRSHDCFAKPGICGYPDPGDGSVGPLKRCARLRHMSSIVIRQAGYVLRDQDVSGSITVTAPNVTIEDVCVFANGHARAPAPQRSW